MTKRKKKRRGHYCWSCGNHLPNERFSGKGHTRHLCKKCARLGKDELAYRSAVRDIDRCLNWDGRVRRKQRKTFENFLTHSNERVRRYAQEIEKHNAQQRREWREARLADEAALEEMYELLGESEGAEECGIEPEDWDESEIPF